MLAAIEQCKANFEQSEIIISAQSYLMKFYRDLGFVACGDYYLEDNIPHMKMRYQVT
jgi:ElaA protein